MPLAADKPADVDLSTKIITALKVVGRIIFLVLYAVYSYLHLLFRFVVPPSLSSLDGEIFLITGAGSGIGREVSLQLARFHPNTKLVLWDFNAQQNTKTAEDAKSFGATVHHYTVDVTNRDQVEETAKKVTSDLSIPWVQEEVGDVTILFNNAGIAPSGNFFKIPADALEKTIQVNLISHFWTLRAFLPNMVKNNHGRIVTTASLASYFGYRNCLPYFASKFAIRGYIEALQDELSVDPNNADKVQFTTIYPGFVETPMTTNVKVELGATKKFLKVDFVARKIIEGIRQNQEKVIIPRGAEVAILAKSLMPKDLYKMLSQYLIKKKTDVN